MLNSSAVQSTLGLSDRCKAWLDQIPSPEGGQEPRLPDDLTTDRLLTQWGVDEVGRRACLEGRPDPRTHPELWWVLHRAYHDVTSKMGRSLAGDTFGGWPSLPETLGPTGRYLYAWVFLAAHPATLQFHQERGIADDISQATFRSLARHITIWRQGGQNATWMLPLILRGVSYRLGRHDFDRYGTMLNVHIPAIGPLDPAASQASFDWARQFFPRHFPEDQVSSFVCHSWLMDDQWAMYLPESSNIVQFQRRFKHSDENAQWGDNDILLFVFDRASDGPSPSAAILNTLPQETTLQRAYVHHLRQGNHWWTKNGHAPF